MAPEVDVVICGGGPVGMGLAIDLGQRGVSVAVVERHAQPQPIPKGQNLTQRTCEHFRAWGCEDALRAAHPIPEGGGIGGMTCYGTLLSPWHYDWLNRSHVRDFYFAANARLPQYATEAVLRARAADLPSVEVSYGTLTGLSQDSHTVEATLSGGRTLRGRYLVGCDGSRSTVRQAAGITETLSDHDRTMALVVFRSTELHDLLKRFPGKAFYNVLHPDLEGYWRFFGRVDHGESWFFHAPVDPALKHLNGRAQQAEVTQLLEISVGQTFALEIDRIGFWDFRVALVDAYRTGRVFLAGDAAHSHPPYGGYGINTGFEDARNLGWKLAATIRGWGSEALLDSYEAERRPVFASTARDFIERFIEDDRAFLETYAPELDLPAFERAWASRNLDAREVHAFEPNYEGSPLIGGNGTPSARGWHEVRARPGHHLAPWDAAAGDALAAALCPEFTLLCDRPHGHLAAAFRSAAAAAEIPLTVAALPDAAAAYGSPSVLVRPDGFVAWAGAEADATAVLARAAGSAAPMTPGAPVAGLEF